MNIQAWIGKHLLENETTQGRVQVFYLWYQIFTELRYTYRNYDAAMHVIQSISNNKVFSSLKFWPEFYKSYPGQASQMSQMLLEWAVLSGNNKDKAAQEFAAEIEGPCEHEGGLPFFRPITARFFDLFD